MVETLDTVRQYRCGECGHRFEATISPMRCPDCGGRLRDLGAVRR
jgi:DNA-directed RNA polymerase subunit RPC12/RpoP